MNLRSGGSNKKEADVAGKRQCYINKCKSELVNFEILFLVKEKIPEILRTGKILIQTISQ